jgi:hypothetical protein
MRPLQRILTFIALLVFLRSAAAQVESDPCEIRLDQPNDLSLQLSVKDGQTIFRVGEIITLLAEYSSSSGKKYTVNTRGYDRSGRLNGMEVFCIDPAAAKDPLSDYFNGVRGLIGGGLGGTQDLGEKTHVVTLELNEWKSLAPGSYRLYVVGYRASETTAGPRGALGRPVGAKSNEVEFQVVPADPAWQEEQLTTALRQLDSPNPRSEEAGQGARILRFLGSEDSTRELARRYYAGDLPFGWELKFGLFGSPYTETAIQGMRAGLKDPQHPVTQEFVQTLALLELQSDPQYRLPPYDEKNPDTWVKARDAYSAELERRESEYMSSTAASLPAKTTSARALTVSELLQSNVNLNEGAKEQLRQTLIASWKSLPAQKQNELIQYRWEQVGGLEFLPVLRAIVSGEPNPNRQIDKPDRASALRRLNALAPQEGRDLILREIADPKGDIGINVLGALPERELPQVEPALLAKLRVDTSKDITFQLLERYGSYKSLPQVKAIYEARRGEWACAPQTAMLRYFLRVQPDYGVAQVQNALTQRKSTGCYKYQLTGLEEYLHGPKLEQIALDALNDPSPEVAGDAASALGRYGSPKSETALWSRLEIFHQKWRDRGGELQVQPGSNTEILEEIRLEQVLVQAIENGQAWLATEQTIRRLKDFASPEMQPELDAVLLEIQRDEYALTLNWWPEGELQYSIGRYSGRGMPALKQKLGQFPPGTHFNSVTTIAEHDRHRLEFAEVEEAAAADGLILNLEKVPR